MRQTILFRNVINLKNILTVIVISFAILSLFPLYWMIVGSLKDMSNLYEVSKNILPTDFKIDNYRELFAKYPMFKWFINSVIVAGCTTFIVIITNTMAGYSFAKKSFHGRNLIFWIIMGTLMLPRQVLIVPMFTLMMKLNLSASYASIMLPAIAWPVGIFLTKQFMHTIPNELLDSARIDGCTEPGAFFHIVIPLSKPVIGALAIFTFIGVWNDYLWQLVIITSKNLITLPVGIASLQTEFVPDFGILYAGAAVASMPIILVFLFFQKYFTRGITLGAVKG